MAIVSDMLADLSPLQKVVVIVAFMVLVGFLFWLLLGHNASTTTSGTVPAASVNYQTTDTTKPLRNILQIVSDYYPYIVLIMVLFVIGHTYVGWSSAFRAALVGGLLLCAMGVAMMYQGITTDGVMDLKTQLFSGSIRSSSAGFLVFVVGSALSLLAVWKLGAGSE